jgi:hypothetical protein
MAWGRGEQGALLYARARVTKGEHLSCYGASAGACTAGTADGPGVRRAHSVRTAARHHGSRLLGQRHVSGCVDLGRRTTSSREVVGKARRLGRRGSAGTGWRRAARGRATSRRTSARPDTVLLGLLLKLIFSKNLNTTRPNFEYESYRSSYPLSIPKSLYGVFLHRF